MITSKSDVLYALESIVAAPMRYLIEAQHFSGIQSCHGKEIPEFELFARLCYGMAPLCTVMPHDEWIACFNRRLLDGTNEESEQYWGSISHFDQKSVELIPILLFLYLNRGKTWDTYPAEARAQIVAWFSCINQAALSNNNWQFFGLLTNLFLAKLEPSYSPQFEKYWDKINAFYLGDGWYMDGDKTHIDYYNAFAFHFYSLLLLKIEPAFPHRALILERANAFAAYYVHFFNEDGSTIPFGRSLIYRFATTSFWSMLAVNGIEPIPFGVMKHLICRNLEWWLSRDIFDAAGFLNLGYTYANQYLIEDYSSWGSPYWALKTFLVLLADDSFWSAVPAQISLPERCRCEAARFFVTHKNGKSTLYPANFHGKLAQGVSKYKRFVYSSEFGFNLSKSMYSLGEAALESTLAFSDDLRHFVTREEDLDAVLQDHAVLLHWSAFGFGKVSTTVIPLAGTDHIRIHCVFADKPCYVFDFGFSYPSETNEQFLCDGNTFTFGHRSCRILSYTGTPDYFVCRTANNANIYHPHTAVPYCRYALRKGITTIIDAFIQDEDDAPYNLSLQGHVLHYELNGRSYDMRLDSPVKCCFQFPVKKYVRDLLVRYFR